MPRAGKTASAFLLLISPSGRNHFPFPGIGHCCGSVRRTPRPPGVHWLRRSRRFLPPYASSERARCPCEMAFDAAWSEMLRGSTRTRSSGCECSRSGGAAFRPILATSTEEISFLLLLQEGRNAERFDRLYGDRVDVKVPAIYWDMTAARVLTMVSCRTQGLRFGSGLKRLTRLTTRALQLIRTVPAVP